MANSFSFVAAARSADESVAEMAMWQQNEDRKNSGHPYWCKVHKCYKIGNTALRGIHTLLREWFYPSYRVPVHTTPASARGMIRGGTADGLLRGKRVDHEVALWAALGYPPTGMHEFTKKLVGAFREWGWTLVQSQIVGGDIGSRVGTAMDARVRTREGKFASIEIKCGMEGYFTKASGKLLAPLGAHASCPKNHAYLQLQLTRILCNLPDDEAWIVRVASDGVRRHRLPAWVEGQGRRALVARLVALRSGETPSRGKKKRGRKRALSSTRKPKKRKS